MYYLMSSTVSWMVNRLCWFSRCLRTNLASTSKSLTHELCHPSAPALSIRYRSRMTPETESRVASWLLEEEKCVSVSGIAFTGSQNRQQAADVLEKVLRAKHGDDQKFVVTKCVVSEEKKDEIPCTGAFTIIYFGLERFWRFTAGSSHMPFFLLPFAQSSN